MFNVISAVALLLLTLCSNQCLCDICKPCECVNTDSGPVAYCRGKFIKNDESVNYEFLNPDEHRSLHKLVLTGNSGTVLLNSQILKQMKYLKQLDLSGNLLENLHEDVFHYLSNLEDLSYSDNRLSSFDISVLNANSSLLRLNLSHNEINSLEASSQSVATKGARLKVLDLSYNNLTDMLPNSFLEAVLQLEYLDLSFNRLNDLKADSLVNLQYLKILRVSNNRLLSLSFQNFPLRLEELYAGGNLIKVLTPKKMSIRVLNVENNEITSLNDDLVLLEELRYLNVSGNSLSGFPAVTLKQLKSLDLSFNRLTAIPESISTTYLPTLRVLNVSGNHLLDLKLLCPLTLSVFEASYVNTIEKISDDTFWKLTEKENEYINVTISNCKKLSTIANDAFSHMKIRFLDLSNNRLAHFSLEKMYESKLKNSSGYLINLQGNPFFCNCSLQWMLEDVVPYLYANKLSFLEELRCAGPAPFIDMRLAHWYGRKYKVFCDKDPDRLMQNFNVAEVAVSRASTFSSSNGMLIALSVTITMLAILIIIGIVLTQKMIRKKRRINRRY